MLSRIRLAIPLLVSIVLIGTDALAAPVVTLNPVSGHPKATTSVSGSGFGASEAVDIYFDTTDKLLVATDPSGNFAAFDLKIPADALPGAHWITAVGRKSGDAAQAAFTVRTNWASFGYDERNQRRNPFENVITTANVGDLQEAWVVKTSGFVQSSPAVANGVVYVQTADQKLSAFAETTGALRWSSTINGNSLSSPAVSGGLVYVGSGDGKVYAFNAGTGALRWTATTGGAIASSPTVTNGIVYIGSADHKVYALDAKTGAVKWSATTDGEVDAPPTVANGIVYVGSAGVGFYFFDALTGAQLWSFNFKPVFGSAVVANGIAYIGYASGPVDALDVGSENYLWSNYPLEPLVLASPALAKGTIYIGAGQPSGSGGFYAIDARTGQTIWRDVFGLSINSSAAIANGLVFVGCGDAGIYALDARSGGILWSASTGRGVYSSPAVSDGMVFVGSNSGKLFAYALDGGNNAVYHRSRRPPALASLHPDRSLKPTR